MELFSFEGRVNRQKYWLTAIGLSVAWLLSSLVLGSILGVLLSGSDQLEEYAKIFSTLLSLIFIIAFFALNVKRLHDIERSGWFSIFSIILPIAIIIGMIKGTDGTNHYGNDPLSND
jgi:uncharacterized membrane protein YhaH (DUF805 family)